MMKLLPDALTEDERGTAAPLLTLALGVALLGLAAVVLPEVRRFFEDEAARASLSRYEDPRPWRPPESVTPGD